MTLNEYISALESLRDQNGGDLRVTNSLYNMEVRDSPAPSIKIIRLKRKREHNAYYAADYRPQESIGGEVVVGI